MRTAVRALGADRNDEVEDEGTHGPVSGSARSRTSIGLWSSSATVRRATVQLGFALALGESLAAVRPTVSALVALLYLAVVGGAIGFVIYFTLLERLGPLEIDPIAYLVPIVTVAIGWAFLDEPVVPAMVASFLVVLMGFVLLTDREIAAELARFRGAGC